MFHYNGVLYTTYYCEHSKYTYDFVMRNYIIIL